MATNMQSSHVITDILSDRAIAHHLSFIRRKKEPVHSPLLRRRTAHRITPSTSPIASPLPPTTQPIWLDKLPLELTTRVASFITNVSYKSVFNFANVSETMRKAMKTAFAGKLDLNYIENESRRSIESGEATNWLETDCVALLCDDVQEICLSGSQFFPQCVQNCLQSPSVTKLVIYDRPCDSDYLLHVSNLRVLDITLARFYGIAPFLKRISIPILDLLELSLKSQSDTCIHEDFARESCCHSLASWFPRVEKLKLECGRCGGVDMPPSFLWNAIEQFPELKDVTLTERVPSKAVARLEQMDRVTLQDGDLLDLAEQIPHHVVGIKTTPNWDASLSSNDKQGNQFKRLAKCGRLEHLSCSMQPGTERDLVDVVGNLQSLNVYFPRTDLLDREVNSLDGEIPTIHPCNIKEAHADAILDALRLAPNLRIVEFGNMSFSAINIRKMLTILGDGLEQFRAIMQSNYSNADEIVYDVSTREELENIVSILHSAALHNPKLKEMGLWSNILRIRDGDLVDGDIAHESILPVLPSLQAAVSVLKRRTPMLDVERWTTLLRQFRASCSRKVLFSEESE